MTEQLTPFLERAVCDWLTMVFIILGTDVLLQSKLRCLKREVILRFISLHIYHDRRRLT